MTGDPKLMILRKKCHRYISFSFLSFFLDNIFFSFAPSWNTRSKEDQERVSPAVSYGNVRLLCVWHSWNRIWNLTWLIAVHGAYCWFIEESIKFAQRAAVFRSCRQIRWGLIGHESRVFKITPVNVADFVAGLYHILYVFLIIKWAKTESSSLNDRGVVYVVNRKLTFDTNKTKQNARRLFFVSLRSMAVLVGRAK